MSLLPAQMGHDLLCDLRVWRRRTNCRPVTRGVQFVAPPGITCWTSFWTIGNSSKILGPSQKSLRLSWCPKLVTGLTNRRPCCPPMSNPSSSPCTAWPDGTGRWDNRMAASSAPRSSAAKQWLEHLARKKKNDNNRSAVVCEKVGEHYGTPYFDSQSTLLEWPCQTLAEITQKFGWVKMLILVE